MIMNNKGKEKQLEGNIYDTHIMKNDMDGEQHEGKAK